MKSFILLLLIAGTFIGGTVALRGRPKKDQPLNPETKYSMIRGFQDAQLRKHRNTVLTLDRNSFWKLVGTTPKNYSIVVLFHDVDLDDTIYKQAETKFQDAANVHYLQYQNQFKRLREESRPLFFVKVQLSQYGSKKEFDKYDLDPSTPNFVFFPASNYSKYIAFEKMDFDFASIMATSMTIPKALLPQWISEVSGVFLNAKKFSSPESSGFAFHQLLFFVIIGNVIAMVAKNSDSESTFDAASCAKMIIGLILWFISGQMCNMIRHAPFVAYSKEGALQFIANGIRDQYIVESCIVMGFYTITIMGMIRLIEIRQNPDSLENRNQMSYEEFLQVFLGNYIMPCVFGVFGIMFFYTYKLAQGS